MTALGEACQDIGPLLARAAALITQPDADGTQSHGKAGSRPPWNQASANALWDALAAINETVIMFGFLVHGAVRQPYPYAATGAALTAIDRLGEAVPQDRARQAARELQRCVTGIMRLPAIDEVEVPQPLPDAECPYCHLPMMMTLPRAGLVYCKRGRFGCWDNDGNPPRGYAVPGRLGPCVEWSDGLVT